MSRILIIATADARGHLMRAQLLYHALRKRGADVSVLTTSDDGARFLAGFDVQAPVLSRHYAVMFDGEQNMRKLATDWQVATYTFLPWHMLWDMLKLMRYFKRVDLVINDSFHPALLNLSLLPPWRKKIVHVFGSSLRRALEHNFTGRSSPWFARLFQFTIQRMINGGRGWIEHDFSRQKPEQLSANGIGLPTPIAIPQPERRSFVDVAVYLNPHFANPDIAEGLELALKACQLSGHLVGEGYQQRQGWLAQDTDWISQAANSRVILTAPGMAGLSAALLLGKPLLLIVTQQPEQQQNALTVAQSGMPHQAVHWQGNREQFAADLQQALGLLTQAEACFDSTQGVLRAEERLRLWTNHLLSLTQQQA